MYDYVIYIRFAENKPFTRQPHVHYYLRVRNSRRLVDGRVNFRRIKTRPAERDINFVNSFTGTQESIITSRREFLQKKFYRKMILASSRARTKRRCFAVVYVIK